MKIRKMSALYASMLCVTMVTCAQTRHDQLGSLASRLNEKIDFKTCRYGGLVQITNPTGRIDTGEFKEVETWIGSPDELASLERPLLRLMRVGEIRLIFHSEAFGLDYAVIQSDGGNPYVILPTLGSAKQVRVAVREFKKAVLMARGQPNTKRKDS